MQNKACNCNLKAYTVDKMASPSTLCYRTFTRLFMHWEPENVVFHKDWKWLREWGIDWTYKDWNLVEPRRWQVALHLRCKKTSSFLHRSFFTFRKNMEGLETVLSVIILIERSTNCNSLYSVYLSHQSETGQYPKVTSNKTTALSFLITLHLMHLDWSNVLSTLV